MQYSCRTPRRICDSRLKLIRSFAPRASQGNRNTPIQGMCSPLPTWNKFLDCYCCVNSSRRRCMRQRLCVARSRRTAFSGCWNAYQISCRGWKSRQGRLFNLGRATLPFYARELGPGGPGQASLGLLLEGDGMRIAYTPVVPAITDSLRTIYAGCETIFVDGTFWSDEELTETMPERQQRKPLDTCQ